MKLTKVFRVEYFFLVIILILTAYLRFYNLGYSDYHGDEHKAFIQLNPGENIVSFLLSQRKGPMQFIISYIPYLFTHDFRNEFAQRLPFSIISVLSAAVFYFLVNKLTKSKVAALFATALLSFNGFIVGFGRIAQYQNLNLLFSFLSLYYFYDLVLPNVRKRSVILGTVFFCLSFLSHWDAIYIIPVILFFYLIFLRTKTIGKDEKVWVTKCMLITGSVILLPFLLPYLYFISTNEANQTYFNRRVSFGIFDATYFKFLIDLYNPYFTFWFISVMGLFGSMRVKKSLPFVLWFVLTFISFLIFFRKPGTHIYNFVIPAIVLCSLAIEWVVNIFPKYLKILPVIIFSAITMFFYYQSCRYFLDTSKEYPYEQKTFIDSVRAQKIVSENKIFNDLYQYFQQKSPVYTTDQKLPLFGFVHKRHWNNINSLINNLNTTNNETCGYITNEDKVISDWYMGAKYSDKGCFYIVGIKRPMNFVADWYLPQYSNRTLIKEYDDPPVVKIFKITPKIL